MWGRMQAPVSGPTSSYPAGGRAVTDGSGREGLGALVEVVRRLRADDGCPWDRAQTTASMAPHLLEEAHEVVEAIDSADDGAVASELGDLLFVVAFLARLGQERGAFDLDTVSAGIVEKMIRRHPHVFDPDHVPRGTEGSPADWERAKAERRAGSVLDGVPAALPALARARRLQTKAAAVGFDWPAYPGVRAKLTEELAELDEAVAGGDPARIADELGDLLFTVVNLSRFVSVDAEGSLRLASAKFARRFRAVEAAVERDGGTVAETDLDTLEAHWQAAKEEPSS